jgi:CheY-like chemotaxis protein
MEYLKLLIVDDIEDNRLVLRAICRKLEGFEIFEAFDGQDAVEKCEGLHPNIVLMDIMMPRMDGFQASEIIKKRFPDTIIIVVTAVIDSTMEEKMTALGVAAYIRKPIDRELIRLKLKSYAGLLTIKGREKDCFADVMAINPFSDEVRNFKTTFTILNTEAIMDFGIWLLGRFECSSTTNICANIDTILELLYALIHQEVQNDVAVKVTIEESFSEMFIHVSLPKAVKHSPIIDHLIKILGDTCILTETMVAFRISLLTFKKGESEKPLVASVLEPSESSSQVNQKCQAEIIIEPKESIQGVQDIRSIGAAEHQVLRESFVHKITAKEYVTSIDSDAFGEVHDLREAALEWESWMHTLSVDGSEVNFHHFAREVLDAYSNAISALYEFSSLSYAIISLSTLIKDNVAVLASDEGKRSNILLFLEGFKNDITSWIVHVFELQDANDIHYLDGSFFSSCMLIESLVTGTQIDISEEVEIEFF